jgi:uncharacterized protein (TIGR02145 family)
LPAAVIKAKAQAELPFGKPKDSEKTSIGMTFGCLKVFPESPGEIQSLLKDVGLKIGTDLAAKSASNAISSVASTGSATTPDKAPAAQQNVIVNVAVIETKVDAEPAVIKEFKPSELRYMTQEIRRQAINNLPKPKFSIIAEEQQDSAVLQKCTDKNCWISLGEKINADFIIRGIIGKFRKNYTFSVEVYDAGNGMLITSSNPVGNEKVEELLSGFYEIAPAFFKKFEDELSGFRKTTPAPSKQAPNTCKTEVDKAKSIYDECVKIGEVSSGYAVCAGNYKNQKIKAEQTCSINNSTVTLPYIYVREDDTFIDSRDRKIYKTVNMPDGKVWMAENLDIKTGNSECYGNSESNCRICGRLYDWITAKTICPGGWHLPTNAEWNALEEAIGGFSTAGKSLKFQIGWNDNGSGTNKYGFSVLPCGYHDGVWGSNAAFWSATGASGEKAWLRYLYAGYEDVEKKTGYKSDFYSVRCVMD